MVAIGDQRTLEAKLVLDCDLYPFDLKLRLHLLSTTPTGVLLRVGRLGFEMGYLRMLSNVVAH